VKDVSIITGFLGSGKTTLLNRLLHHPAMRQTAVLINELGEVGVDHLIVDRLDDDIVLLESGCVCCSVRDDLALSLLRLHERSANGVMPEFAQVVLETTGIADPASILQLLMSDAEVCIRYRLGAVVTVVDACFGVGNFDAVPEAARQVALADRLVISKSDLVDVAELDRLRETLTQRNPAAGVTLTDRASPEMLFARSRTAAVPPPPLGHGGRFCTYQLSWREPVDWASVETWLEGILSARGEDIWRIKGVLNVKGEEQPWLLQSVQHSVYAPQRLQRWPLGTPHTEITFVAQHFPRRAAIASLRPFMAVSINE